MGKFASGRHFARLLIPRTLHSFSSVAGTNRRPIPDVTPFPTIRSGIWWTHARRQEKTQDGATRRPTAAASLVSRSMASGPEFDVGDGLDRPKRRLHAPLSTVRRRTRKSQRFSPRRTNIPNGRSISGTFIPTPGLGSRMLVILTIRPSRPTTRPRTPCRPTRRSRARPASRAPRGLPISELIAALGQGKSRASGSDEAEEKANEAEPAKLGELAAGPAAATPRYSRRLNREPIRRIWARRTAGPDRRGVVAVVARHLGPADVFDDARSSGRVGDLQ